MHKRLIFIGILCGFLIFSISIAIGQNETPQPTEDLSSFVHSPTDQLVMTQYYPDHLVCDKIENLGGARWLDIEVGVSSIEDLLMTLELIGEYQIRVSESNYMNLALTLETNHLIVQPTYVEVCLSDESIIEAIGLLSLQNFDLSLFDFISFHGIPDVVTWTAKPLGRIVFWFDAGIAATIYVGPESEFRYLVRDIYYYPFVHGTEYENEYPFAYTRQDALSSIERNPFDFDAIGATVTAQPSRTPTATLRPRTIEATGTP